MSRRQNFALEPMESHSAEHGRDDQSSGSFQVSFQEYDGLFMSISSASLVDLREIAQGIGPIPTRLSVGALMAQKVLGGFDALRTIAPTRWILRSYSGSVNGINWKLGGHCGRGIVVCERK